MYRLVFILLLLFITLAGFAQEMGDDTNADGRNDRWIHINGGIIDKVSIDRDFDGEIDYIVIYDDKSEKKEEQLDYNYDGVMDDFYYYASGKMVRREIDTNFDSKVDIWVYLEGIYIMKYEKDTDFDGVADFVEDYSEE